jgi:hypothetical protein
MIMHPPEKYSDILKILHVMLLEEGEDVERIPIERVEQELAKDGISVTLMVSEVKNLIARKQAQKRLDAARAKRVALEKLAAVKESGDRSNLREKIASIFSDLGGQKPNAAAAFFRKLDEVDDEDLVSILEDLELLERVGDDPE